MISMRIERSAEALVTIAEIYAYSKERWDTLQAKKYVGRFDLAFKKLAKNPRLGNKYPNVPNAYRVYPVESHVIIYRTTAHKLRIIAIFHMSMDISTRLERLLKKESTH